MPQFLVISRNRPIGQLTAPYVPGSGAFQLISAAAFDCPPNGVQWAMGVSAEDFGAPYPTRLTCKKVTGKSGNDLTLAADPVSDFNDVALNAGDYIVGETMTVEAFVQLRQDWFGGGAPLFNPMTTLGDMIVAAAGGVPAALSVGSEGQFLKVASGLPAWGAGGGGGSSPWPITTPPALTNWNFINPSSAATATQNADGSISLFAQPTTTDDYCSLRLAKPTPPYTIKMLLAPFVTAQPYLQCGLIARESGSDKAVTLTLTGYAYAGVPGHEIQCNKFASRTAYDSSYAPNFPLAPGSIIGMSIREDSGGNRYLGLALDGHTYWELLSVGATDYCTPDEIGFYVDPNNANIPVGATLISWEQS